MASERKKIDDALAKGGWYVTSQGIGSTEYTNDAFDHLFQLLDDTDGKWAIVTRDDFGDVDSGIGFASFERAVKRIEI